MRKNSWVLWVSSPVLLALASCDVSSLPGVSNKLSDADSKAIGAACRHAGRALEDCFALNPEAKQAGVFEGWRDMNDYMVSNKIETVTPQIVVNKTDATGKGSKSAADGHADSAEAQADKKEDRTEVSRAGDKSADKTAKTGKDTEEKAGPERPWIRKKDQS